MRDENSSALYRESIWDERGFYPPRRNLVNGTVFARAWSWHIGFNFYAPLRLRVAQDHAGNVGLSIYVPPFDGQKWDLSGFRASKYTITQFPGGFKVSTYNGVPVADLLNMNTLPPGSDFHVKGWAVF